MNKEELTLKNCIILLCITISLSIISFYWTLSVWEFQYQFDIFKPFTPLVNWSGSIKSFVLGIVSIIMSFGIVLDFKNGRKENTNLPDETLK